MDTAAGGLSGSRMATRLRRARERAFIGRGEELARFRKWLDGDLDGQAVLYIHGPGGIGKSALLRRFADLARDADRPVVEVDGHDVGSADSFAQQAVGACRSDGTVLLIDSFERCGGLGRWLLRSFLPTLPADALVVVACRTPPEAEWRTDLDLSGQLRVLALPELAPAEAAELLSVRGVAPAHQAAVLAHAGGHPLALCLDAETTASVPPDEEWVPPHDVVAELLERILGEIPSAGHRQALQVCAHAYRTTVDLLRAVVPGDDAGDDAALLFDWLRSLPFVESGPLGVRPHDLVRDALDEDLRWRDPQGYQTMHHRMRAHLLERVMADPGGNVLAALEAVKYLHRAGGVTRTYFTFAGDGGVYEDPYRNDRQALLELADRVGDDARVVDYWLRRQPESFFVHRNHRTGTPVAFLACLRLDSQREEECEADPVVAVVWEHVRATGPLREGEHLTVARFLVHPAAHQRPSPVMDLMLHRIVAGFLRQKRLAWSFFVGSNTELWDGLMTYSAHQPVIAPGIAPQRLYGHDWRAMPLSEWLEFTAREELYGPAPDLGGPDSRFEVLQRPAFRNAVRDALRAWRQPDLLAANPLVRSRLVAGTGSPNPVDALRELITEAVDSLLADPADPRLHRLVAATYFHGAPTQEAAAERLGMPYSTYRRHLARGVDRVSAWLWTREVGRSDPPSGLGRGPGSSS